jgi:DNA-binding Lrp family transcriptional regulator
LPGGTPACDPSGGSGSPGAPTCLLHVFFGGPESIIDVLTADQAARLRPRAPRPGPIVALDEPDRRMLDLLRADGRAGVTDLAAATGRSLTTERRRLAELRASGALYFDVDLDYHLLDLRMQTMLWLSTPADQLMATGRALAAHPEVPFVAATTGSTNLYASVLCPDPASLFTYLTTRVAALPATHRIETAR